MNHARFCHFDFFRSRAAVIVGGAAAAFALPAAGLHFNREPFLLLEILGMLALPTSSGLGMAGDVTGVTVLAASAGRRGWAGVAIGILLIPLSIGLRRTVPYHPWPW